MVIVNNFRSEGEPPSAPRTGGLLARTIPTTSPDPLEALLGRLKAELGESNVAPALIELVNADINVVPGYRQSDFFQTLTAEEALPSPSKVARLVLSAVYHLAPLSGSRRLSGALLLNSLRQRHPFDVTWGADPLVKCFGAPTLVRLLQAAALQEKDEQLRGNVLDLLQELAYGLGAGLGEEVLNSLTELLHREELGAFGQVVNSHLSFAREYIRQRNAAQQAGAFN